MTETLTLELACGPGDRRCRVQFTFTPDQDEFVDCAMMIQLPHQLDLRLSGFLFFATDFARLRGVIESRGSALDSPVIDSDGLLTIRAEQVPGWVEWSFEWEGGYPAFPPFNPNGEANSKLMIRGLRSLLPPR